MLDGAGVRSATEMLLETPQWNICIPMTIRAVRCGLFTSYGISPGRLRSAFQQPPTKVSPAFASFSIRDQAMTPMRFA
jgi:hypothetical protein